MNHRTFLIALAAVGAMAMAVGAVDERPGTATHPAADGPPPRQRIDEPPFAPPLPPQRMAELLESIKADQPMLYQHLMELRRRDPRQFGRAMAGLDHFFSQLKRLPEELRRAVAEQRQDRLRQHQLVRQYHAATDEAQRADLEAKIHTLTGKIFDTDQALREFKVGQLEKELKALKDQLADRAARRDTLIGRQVKELLAGQQADDEEGNGENGEYPTSNKEYPISK